MRDLQNVGPQLPQQRRQTAQGAGHIEELDRDAQQSLVRTRPFSMIFATICTSMLPPLTTTPVHTPSSCTLWPTRAASDAAPAPSTTTRMRSM